MNEISIVIPVFNSEENLPELTSQIDDALSGLKYQIILVNDASWDQSWSVIEELHKKNHDICGINLRKNVGQDNAIMAGLEFADGEFVVIMDDDLQHSPYDIRKLVDECAKGFDVCFANFTYKNQALWKNLGSWLNGKVAEIMIRKPKGIYLSPFKVMKKEIVGEIIKFKGHFPYLDGVMLSITDNLTQIDVEHHSRFKGESNYNLIKSIAVFMNLLTNFSIIPLRMATFLGVVSSFVGFLLGIYFIIEYLTADHTVEGWTSTTVLILFMGGVTLLSLGIIGEYLGRAYLQLNNKPSYTIKDKLL